MGNQRRTSWKWQTAILTGLVGLLLYGLTINPSKSKMSREWTNHLANDLNTVYTLLQHDKRKHHCETKCRVNGQAKRLVSGLCNLTKAYMHPNKWLPPPCKQQVKKPRNTAWTTRKKSEQKAKINWVKFARRCRMGYETIAQWELITPTCKRLMNIWQHSLRLNTVEKM